MNIMFLFTWYYETVVTIYNRKVKRKKMIKKRKRLFIVIMIYVCVVYIGLESLSL